MKNKWMNYILLGLCICIGIAVAVSYYPIPVRVITKYPMHTLIEESQMMHECAECHDGEEFHSCDSCHSEHGAVIFDGINFYSTLHITGDIRQELYLPINKIFIKEDNKIDKINIFEFLREYGIETFDEIIFYTNDGGFVIISKENLGTNSYLVPFEGGGRFIDEDLHESTWLKSIIKIIVIGKENNLLVDGVPFSFGKLLSEEAIDFTVERATVMYKNDETGNLKSAETATRIEGVPMASVFDSKANQKIEIVTENKVLSFDPIDIYSSNLTLIDDQFVIVFPRKSRKDWIFGVKEIRIK